MPRRDFVAASAGLAADLPTGIAGNPVDALAMNFDRPASLYEKVPRDQVCIAPSETPRHGVR